MTFDDFVKETTPLVHEIICECLKMSSDEYQEYKTDMWAEFGKIGKPWLMQFWADVFSLIESYRSKNLVKEAAECR